MSIGSTRRTSADAALSAAAVDTAEPPDPHWYKSAVFYEVLVRAFADSNNDGTGDLNGLTGKLDYLQWLGIDCLWLPPIYASPLRDGGYDISDYRQVHPQYGTIADFQRLVAAAHARGMRIITDLVMNHTSDQHQWFTNSRQDPAGPYGDYYVWRDSNADYSDARIVLFDVETSNWTFDPVRGQYFWHRFYSHQPDLNLDNPAVVTELFDILRFWLDLGVDGFRLDAVPYLFEREGTDCAHLPETHEFLRQLRSFVDTEYPGRVLLGEANGWPGEVAQYFGEDAVGDECHMAFHFPLMPQLFCALAQGSRYPVSQVLAETPKIPSSSQWGMFLRNHDELTLEMVTVADREVMYQQYAPMPRMRANEGIRRRLAPLLGGDRDKITLITALLLALPGSPVLYYGDEIGMGDNVWLPDRDSVRTPMQWTDASNGGFSRAEATALYLPMVIDLPYHYDEVNVAAQKDDPTSLLHWHRDMLALRRNHPAFGRGGFADLGGENSAVLAFVRDDDNDRVLCAFNLAETPQEFLLDVSPYPQNQIKKLTAGTATARLDDTAVRCELPGHGFAWWAMS